MKEVINLECRKCGQCGYYMAYATVAGTKDTDGDCASIGMNNECNEGNNHFKDPDELLLQVNGSDDACGFFKAKRTKRVKEYIKAHPDDYYQDRSNVVCDKVREYEKKSTI